MVLLADDRYLVALTAQSVQFAELIRDADLQQQVPTCPEWTLHRLTEHVGQVHRFATGNVAGRATDPMDPREWAAAPSPDDPEGLSSWLRDGAEALAGAIRDVDPQTPVWTWTQEQPARFWARRTAHETAVHRADAALTLGQEFTLDPDLAADAISEWLELLCSPQALERRPELGELRGDGQVLHMHSTDDGLGAAGEWIIRRTPSGPTWQHGHSKGDVAVRGAVVDLLLVLLRRVAPAEGTVQVLGDPAVLEYWLEHTRF